jgi:hypothetical protein
MDATEGLGFSFPIWTVVDSLVYSEKGFPFALIVAGSPGYGNTLPLFERPQAAMVWGAAVEKDGQKLEAFLVPDAAILLQLMGHCQKLMVKYVAINPGPSYHVAAERYVPFADVRTTLEAE